MNEQWLRGILRGIAIAIAATALVDPVLSIERTPAIPLTLIKMTASDVSAIEREVRRVNSGAEVILREAVHHRLPCGPGERCVVIADGSVDAELPPDLDQPFSLIKVDHTAGPNVRLRSVALAAGQHASAAGVARVTVDGRGVVGRRTEIKISDTAALIGSGAVEWKSDGLQTVDVPWWPLASGPRTLRIEVMTAGGPPSQPSGASFPRAASADRADALTTGVDVGSERLPVLVFDARASWGSTFVRRALEDDSRFVVEHRARLAPAIAAGTANGRLDTRALDAAAVLIVGGPDRLTTSDVDLIERFVRVRGGTAVLLPERAPSGSVARLFAGEWSERLTSEPRDVGSLKASELLVYPAEAGHYGVLAHAGEMPVIVAMPTGAGRIIVSGAMDAWRYRDDGVAFDRFWRSVVAEGAAAGARLRLEFENAIGEPGSRQRFTLRYRSMMAVNAIEASAIARCGPPSQPSPASSPQAASADRAQALRLWPAGAPGVMQGELPIGDHGACTVEAAVNDVRVTGGIAVSRARWHAVDETLARLERHARASGGVVTDADKLVHLRAFGASARQALEEHPMRAAWWILPFAGCLSAEWWLRRRRGLR